MTWKPGQKLKKLIEKEPDYHGQDYVPGVTQFRHHPDTETLVVYSKELSGYEIHNVNSVWFKEKKKIHYIRVQNNVLHVDMVEPANIRISKMGAYVE